MRQSAGIPARSGRGAGRGDSVWRAWEAQNVCVPKASLTTLLTPPIACVRISEIYQLSQRNISIVIALIFTW